MDLILLVGSSPYFCFIVIIISGLLFRIKQPTDISSNLPFVSVVIAARNEEANISNLLDDLVKQNIDKNNLKACFFVHDSMTFCVDSKNLPKITAITEIKECISEISVPVKFTVFS